jgi:hypothetical protein
MTTKKKPSIKKPLVIKPPIVRAYRISDETHLKLKELAVADDRKIGSKLTEIINKAHNAHLAQKQA